MEEIDLLEQIKRRLTALQARIEARADPKLIAEVADTVRLADVHPPSVFMQARRVLEIVVRDIYRRELPQGKPKPLANMIEALYEQKGLVSPKIAADLHYIRVNGNLIVHPQDETVEVSGRDAEPVLFVFLGIVEWYLTVHLPGRLGETSAAGVEPAGSLPPPPSPYRGLRAFREQDAKNYFGREPDIEDLMTAVRRQSLVAVVGPSGSGKSSLVFAGVLPRLRGNDSTTDGWIDASFRPLGRPFDQLARALVERWPLDPVERLAQSRKLAAALAAGEIALADAVRSTLHQAKPDPESGRLLLIADQFEELYTLGGTSGADQAPGQDEAARFTDLLVRAVEELEASTPRTGAPALCLVLTLRADFLGHTLAHPGLTALLGRCPPKLIGTIEDPKRLRAIIEQPAVRAGVACEDLLPERILRDLAQVQFSGAAGDADQATGTSLPLLEFTLDQLWAQQQERRLTHLVYETQGGIQQSISRHADSVYARLAPEDQARMRHVLVQMVRPGEGTEDTRQVATRDQLQPDDWPLVARLADERLVVTGHDPAAGQDTAELIHEALIRHWQPLREWIDADRSFRLWQNGLRQAMAEWERTGHDEGALLAGARLAEAEERLASDGERIGAAEAGYITASVARRDAETAERERTRIERSRMERRIRLGLVAFLIFASALGSFAALQWHAAERERSKADAQSVALRDASRKAAEQLSATGRLVARFHEERLIAVFDQTPDQRAMADLRSIFFDFAKSLSPNDDTIHEAEVAAANESALKYKAAVLHALEAQRQPLGDKPPLDTRLLNLVAYKPLSAVIFNRQSFVNWDLGNRVRSIAFSPDGQFLVAAFKGSAISLRNLAIQSESQLLEGQAKPPDDYFNDVYDVAFSPNGRLIAAAYTSQPGHFVKSPSGYFIRLWDVETREIVRTLNGHKDMITSVAFSPDGATLASASADNTIKLWDTRTGDNTRTLEGHSHWIQTVAFSPDGELLASGASDDTIRLWNPKNGSTLRVLTGHQDEVEDVCFSPNGELIASASSDKTVRLWNPNSEHALRILSGHKGTVFAVAFSPNGSLLASGSFDGSVRLWNPETGETIAEIATDHRVISDVAFRPTGRWLATAGSGTSVNEEDTTVELRDLGMAFLLPRGNAPSPRAALISEALQRIWGMKVDGLEVIEHKWQFAPESIDVDGNAEITIDVRTASETVDPTSQPILRTFDIRPLLDPPKPHQDKLDQFLDWLAELERLEPRLRAQ